MELVPDPDDVQALSAVAGPRPERSAKSEPSKGGKKARAMASQISCGLGIQVPTFYHPRILGRTVPHFHVTCSKFAYKKWTFCSCGSQAQFSHILFSILTFYSILTGCGTDRIWGTVGLKGTTSCSSEKGFSSTSVRQSRLPYLVCLMTYLAYVD